MKLRELDPRWFAEPGRGPQGLTFLCPHCRAIRLAVAFDPPIDGGPVVSLAPKALWPLLWPPGGTPADGSGAMTVVPPGVHWSRTGETFETLTLSPSVDASASGHWHGTVAAGEAT